MKRSRGKATAREPLIGRGSTEAAEVRHAQTSSKPVSYTQAAEATTNNENDNEPRGTAFALSLIMKPARESDGAPTPRKKLNGSSRSAIYANRSSRPASYTHTDLELQANQRQAAPSQNAGVEQMKRAWHAEGSPRESDQGLTTPMPWPCSGYMQRKRQ